MQVILTADDPASRAGLLKLLAKCQIQGISATESVEAGLAMMEESPDSVALVICQHRDLNGTLLERFLRASSRIPALVIGDAVPLTVAPREAMVEYFARLDEGALRRTLARLRAEGVLEARIAPDADFIRVPIASLNPEKPPPVDFYLRLAPGRYCLRFRKEDGLDAVALQAYRRKPATEHLYARADGIDGWCTGQAAELDGWIAGGRPLGAEARRLGEESLEIVQNVVSQVGFTPKLEELAKKTVALTLKALGSTPELAAVLHQIRLHEGKYIASHSLMHAEIACALAHQLTWSSSTTFLKLTMAAFLHDLSLPCSRLARIRGIEQLDQVREFSTDEQQAFRDHPHLAAEFSRQLRQLPADVDTIVLQHHERPDGSGFPRGLFHHQITPLACVFIVAQDLLDHFLSGATPGKEPLRDFLAQHEARYSQGTFRKIYESMRTGEPAALP